MALLATLLVILVHMYTKYIPNWQLVPRTKFMCPPCGDQVRQGVVDAQNTSFLYYKLSGSSLGGKLITKYVT